MKHHSPATVFLRLMLWAAGGYLFGVGLARVLAWMFGGP